MASDFSMERSSNEKLKQPPQTPDGFYVLHLYVAGKNSDSRWAINELHDICNEYLRDRHEVRIINIYEHPDLAEADQIVATPTLIKKLPSPLRKFIGDLSDRESILIGLDIW